MNLDFIEEISGGDVNFGVISLKIVIQSCENEWDDLVVKADNEAWSVPTFRSEGNEEGPAK